MQQVIGDFTCLIESLSSIIIETKARATREVFLMLQFNERLLGRGGSYKKDFGVAVTKFALSKPGKLHVAVRGSQTEVF